MNKTIKILGICLLCGVLIWGGSVISDRYALRNGLIRLHVVAASDSEKDQSVKLQVRDAVTAYLDEAMTSADSVTEAGEWIEGQIPQLEEVANRVLRQTGVEHKANVTFTEECFDTRYYETFRLPAGVYESLRITIGEARGRNWWCVVFPTLCVPATTEGFASVAAGAGFDETLVTTLEGDCQIRFFLLDLLGKGENMFFAG